MARRETTLEVITRDVRCQLVLHSPSPLADGSLPYGGVGVPDLAPVLLVPLLQDDPAEAEPGAAVEAVEGEGDDEGGAQDAPGPDHGGGERQHPAPGHLARQQHRGAQHAQPSPITLTHITTPLLCEECEKEFGNEGKNMN